MTRPTDRAFTLIELLVVVAIIVALLAILMPSMSRAMEVASDAVCRTQQRQVVQAFVVFAADHERRLPGIWTQGAEQWQRCWAASEVGAGVASGQTYDGVLVPYLGGVDTVRKLYRCPSLPAAALGSGAGSNGRFDYSAFHQYSGARLTSLPSTGIWIDPGSGTQHNSPLAVLVEEDPAHHINTFAIDAGHGNTDQIGNWHQSGGNIGALDGSVHRLDFTTRGPNTWEWTVRAPSGNLVNPVGNGGYGYWHSL